MSVPEILRPQGDDQEARQAALKGWCAAGLGSLELPSSVAEYQAMGLSVHAQLAARDPALHELLSGPKARLAADLELRLSQGTCTPDDAAALEEAGYLAAATELRRASTEAAWAAFEQGHAAAQEEAERLRPELEAEAEQLRIESQERANNQLRQGYLERLRQGAVV